MYTIVHNMYVYKFSIMCLYNDQVLLYDWSHNFKISNFEIFIGIMNPRPSVKESSPNIHFLIQLYVIMHCSKVDPFVMNVSHINLYWKLIHQKIGTQIWKPPIYPMPHVTDSLGSFFLNIWALILIGYTTFDIYNFRLHDRSKNHSYLLRTTCTRS